MIRNRVRVGQNLIFWRAYRLFDGYFKVIRYMYHVMLAFEWVMIRMWQTFRYFCVLEIWKCFHFETEFGFLFSLFTRINRCSWAIIFKDVDVSVRKFSLRIMCTVSQESFRTIFWLLFALLIYLMYQMIIYFFFLLYTQELFWMFLSALLFFLIS